VSDSSSPDGGALLYTWVSKLREGSMGFLTVRKYRRSAQVLLTIALSSALACSVTFLLSLLAINHTMFTIRHAKIVNSTRLCSGGLCRFLGAQIGSSQKYLFLVPRFKFCDHIDGSNSWSINMFWGLWTS